MVAWAGRTGGPAFAGACMMGHRGMAEVTLGVCCDAAVSALGIAAFGAMKARWRENDAPAGSSRPFDRDRDGFVLAEGAAVVVLESLEHAKARGSKIYAELVGFGITGDAHHIAAPDPNGTGAGKALEFAVTSAGLNTPDIGYIHAHGPSTPLGDSAEAAAAKRVSGRHASAPAI